MLIPIVVLCCVLVGCVAALCVVLAAVLWRQHVSMDRHTSIQHTMLRQAFGQALLGREDQARAVLLSDAQPMMIPRRDDDPVMAAFGGMQ